MPQLILVRHGQSIWNAQERFTGWVDVPLTEIGREEARRAGRRLAQVPIDVCYTSTLVRATDTLQLILQERGGQEVPVIRDLALNERNYGDLQGLSKPRTVQKFGAEQVKIWRRSVDIAPPNGESLKDTAARTIPFLNRCILGDIYDGRNVLVVAHGNSNRSIVMKLENLTPEQVLQLELGTGVILAYDLNQDGEVQAKQILQ